MPSILALALTSAFLLYRKIPGNALSTSLSASARADDKTVIFNNHGYASQQGGLEHHYPDGYGARGAARALATAITPRPNYPKLVEALGGWGSAVDHPAQIMPAIKRGIEAVQEGTPALVDVSLAW